MTGSGRREPPGGGNPWDDLPYRHARRAGNRVWVGATTGAHPDGTVPGDLVAQTRVAARSVERALTEAGALATQVVMLRVYALHTEEWRTIMTVLADHFGEAAPAATLVQVARLPLPEHLVAIEVEAVIGG